MLDLSADYDERYHDQDGWSSMRCRVSPQGTGFRVTLVVEGSSRLCVDDAPFSLLASGLGHDECLRDARPTRREYQADATIERVYGDWPLVRLALANGWWLYFDLAARRFVDVDRFSFDVPFPGIDVAHEAHVSAILGLLRQIADVFLEPSESPLFATRLCTDNASTLEMHARRDGQSLWANHVPLRFQPWRQRDEIAIGGRCAPEHHARVGALAASFEPPA